MDQFTSKPGKQWLMSHARSIGGQTYYLSTILFHGKWTTNVLAGYGILQTILSFSWLLHFFFMPSVRTDMLDMQLSMSYWLDVCSIMEFYMEFIIFLFITLNFHDILLSNFNINKNIKTHCSIKKLDCLYI